MVFLIEGYFWMLWIVGIIYTFEAIEKQPGYEQGARIAARIISFVLATIIPLIYMFIGIYALAAITTFIQERDRVK